MPGGAYEVYAADLAESCISPVQSFTSPQYNVTSSGSTTYMPVSAQLGMNLAGILVYAQSIVTPSAATAVVSGADELDLVFSGYEVTNQVGGGVRCKVITRKGGEEAERLFLAPPTNTTFAYPRASPSSFTATTAAVTYNSVFFIPSAGGQSANLKIYWPGASQVYSTTASISSIQNTYQLYSVPTLSKVTTSYQETLSRVIGSGQNDMMADIPAGMSPDFLELVGTTWGTGSTNVSKVVLDAQGGAGRTLDIEDIYTGNAAQTLFPNSQAANQSNIVVGLLRQRADHLWITTGTSWSASLDELWTQLDYGSPLTPEPAAAPTPVPPLTQNVAGTNASGQVVPRRVAGGVGSVSPPGRRVA